MENNYNQQIQQYAALLQQGVITREEYDLKVRQLTAYYQQQAQAQQQAQYQQQPQYQQPVINEPAKPSFGWAVLCFFFPVVGLILFLVWKDQKPKTSKLCGKAALIGFIIQVILNVIFFFLGIYAETMYSTMY